MEIHLTDWKHHSRSITLPVDEPLKTGEYGPRNPKSDGHGHQIECDLEVVKVEFTIEVKAGQFDREWCISLYGPGTRGRRHSEPWWDRPGDLEHGRCGAAVLLRAIRRLGLAIPHCTRILC